MNNKYEKPLMKRIAQNKIILWLKESDFQKVL